jgi:serine/threonine protein kinase
MGEVYRARDNRLDREVALKILSVEFAADPDRLQRFGREAQTLAALNHPHIAQIYGLEDTGEGYALVMELVDGEDLAARVARGPMPIEDVVPIAEQMAEALEAAHEQGIVHRDLKPANVKIRSDGTAKVLDFGLAKVLEPSSRSTVTALASSPTMASPGAMTSAGMLLGTAAYMSPEQARAKRLTNAPIFGRSALCCTRCSPVVTLSAATL